MGAHKTTVLFSTSPTQLDASSVASTVVQKATKFNATGHRGGSCSLLTTLVPDQRMDALLTPRPHHLFIYIYLFIYLSNP